MGVQTEQALENNLIKDLVSNGYVRVYIKDEAELIQNFKLQFEQHNAEKLLLAGISTLTDNEFNRIMNHLNGGSIFQKAKKLRGGLDFKLDNNEICYLSFINTNKWCQNIFQVANQITMKSKYTNRYDVTILINGLPLVQIELKRKGKELKEAFHQIGRYQRHTYHGLFNYIQLFVLTNGVDTKYFSNNKELNFKQSFFWTDIYNSKYSRLDEFTEQFLEKCHLSKMISKYIVLNETSKSLMVLRPYQYYAVEEIIKSVESKAMKNGYIWHTTGSGKTLTSFKASQILATIPEVDKVVFCVDRKDLDFNTMKEFNSFSPGSVDSTENTKQLLKNLVDSNKKILITTMQKLNNVVSKEHHLNKMECVKNKRIVFIFDECHRSQFGDSHGRIDKYFTNKQFFGFTGTPIFAINAIKNKTTEMLFGKQVHRYIIKDAIADDNVLGFSVEYLSTFKDSRLVDSISGLDIPYDEQVEGIDKKEVYNAAERLELVVDHILSIHDSKTKNKEFTAMFAVSSIPTLIKYYDIFKRKDHNLKIATIFSYKANDDSSSDGTYHVEEKPKSEAHARERLDEYVDDYNQMFGANYDLNKDNGFNGYYIDVSKKVKERKIDILLVVNMFLTGFDSKTLNTLYIDKNVQYHGLIQAYSRTNRILGEKKRYGNIVSFRNLIDKTNEAITLYSDADAIGTVLMKSYEEYIKDTNKAIDDLINYIGSVDNVDTLKSESDKSEFIRLFRNVSRGLNMLDTFTDFSYDDVDLSQDEIEQFRSKYLRLHDEVKKDLAEVESILSDIDFEIELLRKDNINVDYIIMLLNNLDKTNSSNEKDIEFILKQMDASPTLRSKKELIEQFIYDTHLVGDLNVEEPLDIYMESKKNEEIVKIANENNLDKEKLKEIIDEYEYSNKINNDLIKKSFVKELKFMERTKLTDKVNKLIETLTDKFVW